MALPKICFVQRSLSELGGVKTVVTLILKNLNRNAFDVYAVTTSDDVPLENFDKSKLVEIRAKRIRHSLFSLIKAFKKLEPDLIVTSSEEESLTAAIALMLSGRFGRSKLIWWQHLHFSKYIKLKSDGRKAFEIFWRIVFFLVSKIANHIICCSDGVRSDIIRALLLPATKVTYIQYPIPIPKDRFIGDVNIESYTEIKFAFVGRLEKNKQVDHIFKAIELLPRNCHIHLDIFGDGSERGALERYALKLPDRHNIRFMGMLDDPWSKIFHPTVLVLSSIVEGYGLVLLEAKIRGFPAISYDCPAGPSEIIKDKVDGFLVPPQDIVKLSLAMQKFLNDFAIYKNFSAEAMKGTLSLSTESLINNFEDFFLSVK